MVPNGIGDVNRNTNTAEVAGNLHRVPEVYMGDWKKVGALASAAAYNSAALIAQDHLYLIGGNDGSIDLGIQRARIESDGSLGAWRPTGTTFKNVFSYPLVATDGKYIVVAGGWDILGSSNANNVLQVGLIRPDGELTLVVSDFCPFITCGGGMVAHNGYLYIAGGFDTTNGLNSVWSARLGTDGRPLQWTKLANLPTLRAVSQLVAIGSYLYSLPGKDTSKVGVAQLQPTLRAKIEGSGLLGPWESVGAADSSWRYRAAVAAGKDKIYTVGGLDSAGNGSAVTARIELNGSNQAVTLLPPFPQHILAMAAAYDERGLLYVLGGNDNDSFAALLDVWALPVE